MAGYLNRGIEMCHYNARESVKAKRGRVCYFRHELNWIQQGYFCPSVINKGGGSPPPLGRGGGGC